MAQTGSVELSISLGGYGGDFELDPITGDLVLAQDVPGNPAATIQRLTRLLLTSPRPFDVDGNAIGPPDDLFHPDYGAGLPAAVGENMSAGLVNGITARVLNALSQDPYIASSPKPTVSVIARGAYLYCTVACLSILGDPIVITELPISGGG